MVSVISMVLFVILAAQLIGKILMHFYPESGIRFDAGDRSEA